MNLSRSVDTAPAQRRDSTIYFPCHMSHRTRLSAAAMYAAVHDGEKDHERGSELVDVGALEML
jgi:hypothetical protein